jgi:hypothetical protein
LRQQQARAERYLLLQRVHVQPQYQRASAHGTRHPSTSRWCTMRAWQALAGGGSSSRVTHRGAGRGAARQLDVPRSADIIYKVSLQGLSGQNHVGIPVRAHRGVPGPDVRPEKSRLRRECARRGPRGCAFRANLTVLVPLLRCHSIAAGTQRRSEPDEGGRRSAAGDQQPQQAGPETLQPAPWPCSSPSHCQQWYCWRWRRCCRWRCCCWPPLAARRMATRGFGQSTRSSASAASRLSPAAPRAAQPHDGGSVVRSRLHRSRPAA